MLKLDDIRVTIKGFIILRGFSLDIPAGGLVGLVGSNGAGKTTTLKSVMGIVSVTGGSIRFDGQDLLQVPGHRRAHLGIGYMPEDRRLIDEHKVDLLVMNSRDEDQLAMHGLAYPLAVELNHVPMLLL